MTEERTIRFMKDVLLNGTEPRGKEAENNLKWGLQEYLKEQLILHGVSKSLKDKHAQALFEYKQQLKETDNNDTLFIDNKEEWIRQTSILEGKISVLESL